MYKFWKNCFILPFYKSLHFKSSKINTAKYYFWGQPCNDKLTVSSEIMTNSFK